MIVRQTLFFFDWLVRHARVFSEVLLHFGIAYHGENDLDTEHGHVAAELFANRADLLTLEAFQRVISAPQGHRTCEVRITRSPTETQKLMGVLFARKQLSSLTFAAVAMLNWIDRCVTMMWYWREDRLYIVQLCRLVQECPQLHLHPQRSPCVSL